MKLCVFGATGNSGLRLVEQSLDAGHEVVALVRSPDKLTISHEKLKVVKVDVLNSEELVPHMEGCDAVMSCLGYKITFFTAQYFYSESCKAIVAAMRKAGTTRFIAITSWCTTYQREHPFFIEWILKPLFIGRNLADMQRMEEYLEKECPDIIWTCVKPPGLTNGPATEKPIVTVDGEFVPDGRVQISRADVTRIMLSLLTNDEWNKKLVSIAA